MAGWLKHGLSTLGEGLSTLTKEILAEEPPDYHDTVTNSSPRNSSGASLNNAFESLGSRAEIDRLRTLVSDLEDRAMSAETKSSKYYQILHEYETLNASLQDKVSHLQVQLDSMSPGLATDANFLKSPGGQVNGDTGIFRDIDLLSNSPPPDLFSVRDTTPSNSFTLPNGDSPSRERHLSYKESVDYDLLEALEHELSEKDITIRHLTQEISRSKALITDLESAALKENYDGEVQTNEEDVKKPLSVPRIFSDQSVQSDHLISSDSQSDSVPVAIDASTSCDIPASGSEVVIQAEDNATTSCTSIAASQVVFSGRSCVEVQTDSTEDRRARTFDTGVQSEQCGMDGYSQTELFQARTLDSFDQETQHDSETLVAIIGDQETQSEGVSERLQISTQTDVPDAVGSKIVETLDVDSQTATLPVYSRETQSDVEVFHRGDQSEISGDVTMFQDYSRIVEESQDLHSQLGNLSTAYDRSRKEVERLRAHLLLVEQGFAQDFQLAQNREDDLRQIVKHLEAQITIGASSEQSVLKEVQSQFLNLTEEVRVLTEARDLVVSKLHDAEKKNAQLESSLINLRLAFEHMDREHRTEVDQEREKGRRAVRNLEAQFQSVSAAKNLVELRAAEVENRLLSSLRITAEADAAKMHSTELLRQLEEKSQLLVIAQDETASVGKVRVDIALMKNMLMGYLIGPKNCQQDILRMMMSTLNFDELERQKVQTNQTSTLRSLISTLSPGKGVQTSEDSFGSMLVKFIEQESKPKSAINGAAEETTELPRRSFGPGSFVSPPPSTWSLNTQRSHSALGTAVTGRSNTLTDPSMAQDRMLEDILNGPHDKTSRPPSVDIV